MRTVNELHLLLIEDNPGDAALLQDYLEDVPGQQFRISHVTSLAQALERLPDRSIDLIVLDLNLPDSTGIETIVRIHEAAPRTPVAVLSGVADEELGQKAIHAGAQDFLHKNALEADTLARSLRYATERGRLQSQLRTLVENNADAIVVVSEAGMVTYINRAAEELFGRSRGEIVGQPCGFPGFPGFPPKIGDMTEISVERPGGETRAVEVRAVPIDWEGQSASLATVRDVTDRKRAEDLQRRLFHADRLASIGQLASGVAHEINNPAAFIHNNLVTLDEHMGVVEKTIAALLGEPDPDARPTGDIDSVLAEMRKVVSDNIEGIGRISKIVKGLSTFSRIERDEVELVDVNDVLEIACSMTANEIRHRAVLYKDLGVVPRIAADRAKLAQVFTNLLINAVHAIPVGAVDKNRIEVSTSVTAEGIQVRVKDTGSGIAKEDLDKIFTPFFTTKPRGLGTGLGLPLSAEIIRRHRGELRVVSDIGKGTCFEVVLPVDTGMSVPKPVRAAPARRANKSRGRILVIDDEPMLLESMNRMLRRAHQVTLVQGGRGAVALLEKGERFDVVICDLMMPDLDGMALYEIVAERWPALAPRFVFCSGGAFTTKAKDFVALRSEDSIVLEKPVLQRTLLEAADTVLGRHGTIGSQEMSQSVC